jgi:hypothetical protein
MHPPGIEECTSHSLCLRGLSALGMEDNPVQWQLEQVAELKKLAVAMNWKETSKEYKFELKRIHLKARGEDESADTEVKQEKIKWPPFKGWVKGESGKFRDKDAARVGLLVKLHAGRWINDKNCPNSEAEEGRKAHRCVNKTTVGGPYLARLVDIQATHSAKLCPGVPLVTWGLQAQPWPSAQEWSPQSHPVPTFGRTAQSQS